MGHIAPSAPICEAALAKLDHLITEAEQCHDSQRAILVEHLQSAQVYLRGGMPDEYEFSLIAAKDTAGGITDPALQGLVKRELTTLLRETVDARPPFSGTLHRPRTASNSKIVADAGMKSELYNFFHGSGTKLGVFHPTHYIFAAFPSFQAARNAAAKLEQLGFSKDELVAVSGTETLRFFDEMKADVGLWGALMAGLSRFFGTEEVFADIDISKAHEGAGFLAVYCPKEQEAERVRDLLTPFEPLSMQLYLPGGVRSLWAGKSPGPQGNHPGQH